MRLFGRPEPVAVTAESALRGTSSPRFPVPELHEALGTPLKGPWPEGTEVLYVAMGCFWGGERLFWRQPGVVTTAVGYMGGFTENPTYEETCSGRTGHAEAIMVAYDPAVTSPEALLKVFWENHDPTTANRQGNDIGTQYRSAIYWTTPAQKAAVESTSAAFGAELERHRLAPIATEFKPAEQAGPFYYAEGYHQQYLFKNPGGYCNHGPNGLTCPIGVANLPAQTDVLPADSDIRGLS